MLGRGGVVVALTWARTGSTSVTHHRATFAFDPRTAIACRVWRSTMAADAAAAPMPAAAISGSG